MLRLLFVILLGLTLCGPAAARDLFGAEISVGGGEGGRIVFSAGAGAARCGGRSHAGIRPKGR